jgi:hypothetical protein
MTEFLSRPRDVQTRSGLVLTRGDSNILRLLGVRYVITNHEFDFGHEAIALPLKDETVRLIELNSPNLANYSPTTVRHVSDFHTGLSLIHEPTFDGATTVVTDATDAPLDEPLTAATNSRLTYEAYGFQLEAESRGHSVLIVPTQFSRCWTVEGSGSPRLFRTNLAVGRSVFRQIGRQIDLSLRATVRKQLPP